MQTNNYFQMKSCLNVAYLLFPFLILVKANCSFGQEPDPIFKRLSVITREGINFYNIDGIEIIAKKVSKEFNTLNICEGFPEMEIKQKELNLSDNELPYKNYFISKTETLFNKFTKHTRYYFIQATDNRILAVVFQSIDKVDKIFERKMIGYIEKKEIPKSLFAAQPTDSINFAGRYIKLQKPCHWMNVNNIQCQFNNGQIDWSMHESLIDAEALANFKYHALKNTEIKSEILKDIEMDALFEGEKIKVKKLVQKFKGARGAALKIEGSNILNVYIAVAKIRGNYISCTMSHWADPMYADNFLPGIISEIMTLPASN